MPGPLPKRDRARRNRPAGGDWQELPDRPYEGPKPRRPPKLHAFARHCWETWWEMPVAHMWEADDRLEVVRLVRLMERVDREPDCPASLHTEARHTMDRLGLTRKGRLANRYDMPERDGEDEPGGHLVDARERFGQFEPDDLD